MAILLLAATDFFLANCSDGDAWRDRALLERLTQRWRTRVYCGSD